jgi:hypothetical protein
LEQMPIQLGTIMRQGQSISLQSTVINIQRTCIEEVQIKKILR